MKRHIGDFPRHAAACAARALLYELSATPKPGLVDRANNGAHADMDFTLFIDSACSLIGYFEDLARLGLECSDEEPAAVFAKARALGVEAEGRMLEATKGVNTHKGAVFSLGLACLAAGRLFGAGEGLAPKGLLGTCARLCGGALADFEAASRRAARTHGEEQYLRYGTSGARGEAANGFPAVRSALPVLEGLLEQGASANDASVVVLLHLLACVQDSNIAHRASPEALAAIMDEAGALFAQGLSIDGFIANAAALDERFIRDNISPGGCADLLALTWFTHFLGN